MEAPAPDVTALAVVEQYKQMLAEAHFQLAVARAQVAQLTETEDT